MYLSIVHSKSVPSISTALLVISGSLAVLTASPQAAEQGRVALHAAPHEVAPIVRTLAADDPLLAERAPILIPTDDPSVPPRQNPWQWVEISGSFTGYISLQQMTDRATPQAAASILSAPDLDSPLLVRVDHLDGGLVLVGTEGPFARVRFQATLPLFVDPEAPLVEGVASVSDVLNDADLASGVAERPIKSQADSETPIVLESAEVAPIGVEPTALERPVVVAPVEPSPVMRLVRGRLVSSREAGIRRAAYPHVILSPAGRPLAYADLQFFRATSLSNVLNQDGSFSGAVLPGAVDRSALPVMQVRTFRAN